MPNFSLRLLRLAPRENLTWLAGCVGAGLEELSRRYYRDRQEIAVLYGGGCELKTAAAAASGVGMQVYHASGKVPAAEHVPSALFAGSRTQFEELAGDLETVGAEAGNWLRRALSGRGPEEWKIGGGRSLALDHPLIMGVLNLTPDSFHADSRVGAVDEALRRASEMAASGARIIDLGGESTRPGAEEVSEQEEIDRVVPVIEAVAAQLKDVPVSIDTYKAGVAAAALDAGAAIVNDIGAGLLDEGMLEVVAGRGAGYVMMHMRGRPRTMQRDTAYDDLLGEVHRFFHQGLKRCTDAGIDVNNVVLDPGIGFGKPAAGNFELIARLDEFQSLGRALLIGASRKSFLALAGQADSTERLEGTLAACTVAVLTGAKILRVHDVAPAHRAVATAEVFAAHIGRG